MAVRKHLTPQEIKFVDAYLETLNAMKAAEIAGYKNAKNHAHRILDRPIVQEAIKARKDELLKDQGINPERVIAEYGKMAFASLADVLTIGKRKVTTPTTSMEVEAIVLKDNADLSLLAEISETPTGLKIKMHDKKGSLDSLSKYFGLFEKDNKQKQPEGLMDLLKMAVNDESTGGLPIARDND